jgi:hypothetical protein
MLHRAPDANGPTSVLTERVDAEADRAARGLTLTTRLAIAMIMLVAIAVFAVGYLSYRNLEQTLLPRVLDRIETHSRLMATDLQSYVRGARADVAIFSSNAAARGMITAHFNGGIDPVDHIAYGAWREHLERRIAADLAAKPAYSQFRFIGVEDGGRELLRVDHSGPGGAIRIVPDAELPRKGDRSFFQDTIRLAAGDIYVSRIDLNQKTKTIPTLRVASPVFAPDGKPFGIVIINVDMGPAFEHLRKPARQGEHVYIVASNGDYLVHPDKSREFGSQFDKPTDWRADFPYFAPLLGANEGGAEIVDDADGKPGGAALAPALLAGKEWVGVIGTVPNSVFMAPATAIRNTSLAVGLIAVLCAAALAVIVARSLTGPDPAADGSSGAHRPPGRHPHSSRRGRRDRRAGASLCAHHRRSQCEGRCAGRAAEHLRDIAGSDPDQRFLGDAGSGQPERRGDPGLSAGGDDRPERKRFHPSRRS